MIRRLRYIDYIKFVVNTITTLLSDPETIAVYVARNIATDDSLKYNIYRDVGDGHMMMMKMLW